MRANDRHAGRSGSLLDAYPVIRHDGEMARPIGTRLKDIENPLIVGIGIVSGQPKQDYAGRSRETPPKGQGTEVFIMCNNQAAFLDSPEKNSVVRRRSHGLFDGHPIMTPPFQLANDGSTDVFIGDDAHLDH
jgi:hypothetical protein